MKKISINTAHGENKRIPRKNIKYFLGKPIIAYNIKAALKFELFYDIMVSTDDDEIDEVAKKYGVSITSFMWTKKNAEAFCLDRGIY